MDYLLKYNGRNFVNFLNYIKRNNISIKNINQKEDSVEFKISPQSFKKLIKINKIFKLEVVKQGGLKGVCKTILKRIGVLIGVVIILFWSMSTSQLTLKLKVIGNENISEDVIRNAIEKYGYVIGKSKQFNKEEMEKYLLENIEEISMVSVAKSGNVLLVNIVEKAENLILTEPYYSPYNMVIKDIELVSGTLAVKKGDIVKKGDVLVYDYIINSSGEKISVSANANICADVYFSSNIVVSKISKILVKTGNKISKNSISFFKPQMPHCDNIYSLYDKNATHNVINMYMFLPIYYNKIEYYEMVEKEEVFDYENNKEKLLKETIKNAYTFVPKGVIINNEISEVNECSDKYIFQAYLISEMRLINDN